MKHFIIFFTVIAAFLLISCSPPEKEPQMAAQRGIASTTTGCVKGQSGLKNSPTHMALLKKMGGNEKTPFGLWMDGRDNRKKMIEFKTNGTYVLYDADKKENEAIPMTLANFKAKKFKKVEVKKGNAEFCLKDGKLVAKAWMGPMSQEFPMGQGGNLKRIQTQFMQWDFDYRKVSN